MNIIQNDDPFYRYKMPKMILTVQGNFTVITNITDVAAALNRDPVEILKMFGYKRSTSVNEKKWMINGTKYPMLQDDLTEYINTYIRCQTCDNPETTYLKEKNKLYMKCAACSAKNKIDGGIEKLSKYILSKP